MNLRIAIGMLSATVAAASPALAQSTTAGVSGPMDALLQFVPLAVISCLWLIPALHVLKRVGRSRWWAALFLVPLIGGFVLFCFIAYARWPRQSEATEVF